MKISNLFLIAFFITNILVNNSLAQNDPSPFMVNPVIGDTLSLAERNYYQLFPQIDGFQWAVFYLNPDSSLNANVKYISDKEFRDTLINNYKSLKTLTYHINARNALENESRDGFYPVYKPSNEKGSEVCAYMNDGKETSGELLSVRKSSILILKPDCDENLNNLDCVIHRKASEIDKLIIKGNSNIIMGIGLGLLASVVAAGVIYQANYKSSSWGPPIDEEAVVSMGIATFCCISLGTAVGIITSTPDKTIEPFSEDDIVGLSSYSRFPAEEPHSLKKVK